MKCEEITQRREWCTAEALPGSSRCRVHQDGPTFDATGDDYAVADARERDR